MKLAKIIAAAGLTVAAVTMSTSADAQNWRNRGSGYDQRYDRHDRHDRWDRGHHRGWDNGRHYGWNRHQRDCRTFWRHHRRVTVCYR